MEDPQGTSRNLDGWSSLVMIPVSHTGGREFKSLPIHLVIYLRSFFYSLPFKSILSLREIILDATSCYRSQISNGGHCCCTILHTSIRPITVKSITELKMPLRPRCQEKPW